MIGYYVTVRNDSRTGLLLGPYDCHADAKANVERTREAAERIDPWAGFYAFGTARVEHPTLPAGRLNERIGLQVGGR